MVTAKANESKESETSKKSFNLHEKVGKLGTDIDTLAKKTGDEASKLAKNINGDIKSLAAEMKSIDVKDEVKSITGRVEKLVDATGDGAKKLALEIKADVKKLVDKVDSSISKKK